MQNNLDTKYQLEKTQNSKLKVQSKAKNYLVFHSKSDHFLNDSIQYLVLKLFLLFFILSSAFCILHSNVKADELEDIAKQIAELEKAKSQSENATKPLESEVIKLKQKLDNIQYSINQAKINLDNLEISINKRENDFSYQYKLLANRAESFYKNLRQPSNIFLLFSQNSVSSFTRQLSYRKAITQEDKNTIIEISQDLSQLEKDKDKFEKNKIYLEELEQKANNQKTFFEKEIAGAKQYQKVLSEKITELTAKQQQIISQRQASLNLPQSLGAGTMICTDDRKLDPGFSPAFAFYSYGIPHRVGLNQYGAYGRAKAGQNYEQILQAYFTNISFETGKENMNIKVQGHGEINLEEYLKGVYEMPGDWPIEALKAQVIAARSYALAYTNNGAGEICTTQSCQVYKGGNKGGQWEQAVNETKGKVMVNNGQVIKAWYSSTDGGYTFTSGDIWGSNKPWTKRLQDTSSNVNSFAELNERAYDKDSPCFYSAQGWRDQYGKSAWLKSEEVADIANVIMLAKRDSQTGDHLYQTDKSHPYGGEIWDENRVKQELKNRGGTPIDNVNNISISADFVNGRTTSITINGISFGGDDFRNWFNLRAPANIQIVGYLYNIEKK